MASDPFEINTRRVGVSIEDEGKTMMVKFSEQLPQNLHTIIDLHRIGDLEYKTRIMRYFGGMIRNNTYHFERLVVQNDGVEYDMEFNRQNVSLLVNLMCQPEVLPAGVTLADNSLSK